MPASQFSRPDRIRGSLLVFLFGAALGFVFLVALGMPQQRRVAGAGDRVIDVALVCQVASVEQGVRSDDRAAFAIAATVLVAEQNVGQRVVGDQVDLVVDDVADRRRLENAAANERTGVDCAVGGERG